MNCPACGFETSNKGLFCSKCGLIVPLDNLFVNEISYYHWLADMYKTKSAKSNDNVGYSYRVESVTRSNNEVKNVSKPSVSSAPKVSTANNRPAATKPVTTRPNPDKDIYYASKRADEYRRKGDYASELKELSQYTSKAWSNGAYVSKLAQAYYDCGQIDNSIRCYERCIAINPGNPSYYSRLGQIYIEKNNFFKALPLFEDAYMIMDANKNLYRTEEYYKVVACYGASLYRNGNRREGETFLKLAESHGYRDELQLRKKMKGF